MLGQHADVGKPVCRGKVLAQRGQCGEMASAGWALQPRPVLAVVGADGAALHSPTALGSRRLLRALPGSPGASAAPDLLAQPPTPWSSGAAAPRWRCVRFHRQVF